MPAAGGSISNLEARAGTTARKGESWTVSVIDETPSGTQTTAITCAIGEGSSSCSNTAAAAVAPGDYLMVSIKPASRCLTTTTWRVSFRF